MKIILIPLLLFSSVFCFSQSYEDSMATFFKNYVETHDVVKGSDTNYLQFFSVNKSFRVKAAFEQKENSPWFQIKTSGLKPKTLRLYGIIKFVIHDTLCQLSVYQSDALLLKDEYKNYLFIPFTDATTGSETYGGGRYMDIKVKDIIDNHVIIDFNKAYNPSCAYVSGKYNCPIPPPENALPVAIRAGERIFGKSH